MCTLHGLPLGWALVGAKTDERDVLEDLLATPALASRPGRRTVIADKGYYGRDCGEHLNHAGIDLLRPARQGEKSQATARFFRPLRQVVSSRTVRTPLYSDRVLGFRSRRSAGERASSAIP
ncbi:MAG: hypothetical protein IPL43_04315 [Micropruina sp.]|nr:hypothetical protein [Micropruina sp.]